MTTIERLFKTPFKCKKGTSAYKFFKNKKVWITRINSSQGLALSNLSPKKREEDYADSHEISSAWHSESELQYHKIIV